VKVLLVAFYFPPAGGGGVQRPLKLARYLSEAGIETHVLAPLDPKWVHRDDSLELPRRAVVHRARFLGPRGRTPAEELYGTAGLARLRRRGSLFGRRLLVPDEAVAWVLTAVPAAIRLVRKESIDVIVTTSPPNSNQLVGAAAQKMTGVRWVADLRDPLFAHPHRDVQRRIVRLKEQTQQIVASVVARRADAVVCVSEAIAGEMTRLGTRGSVAVIANGADFDDYEGLAYTRSDRFRITHAGSFFGNRDPKPFLSALARVGGVSARFVGDFRGADRDWALDQGLGDRVEFIPFVPHRRSLELQRDSEVLLLLIPDSGGRGRHILSGKVFEYLAAERPILALVPPDGAAAQLVREIGGNRIVAPDDIDGIEEALVDLRDRWLAGPLNGATLTAAQREQLSRRARIQEFAQLLENLL
jgi:glycosyltransferase involved in cell wall biosynthesis